MDRLDDEGFVIFLLSKLRSKVIHLLRKNPSFWEEVVFIWEDLGHPHEVLAEIIFS